MVTSRAVRHHSFARTCIRTVSATARNCVSQPGCFLFFIALSAVPTSLQLEPGNVQGSVSVLQTHSHDVRYYCPRTTAAATATLIYVSVASLHEQRSCLAMIIISVYYKIKCTLIAQFWYVLAAHCVLFNAVLLYMASLHAC